MTEPITRADIESIVTAGVDRLERRFDYRFDRFETHFDDAMTSLRVTIGEIHETVREERRRELGRFEGALLHLARRTGHFDEVGPLLHPTDQA